MGIVEKAPEDGLIGAVWGPVRARQRRRVRETPLSVDEICRVALDLIDREGLEALTMRSLARAFGASPSALYWYVQSKEELLDRVRDVISGEMRLHEIDIEQDWKAAATDGARRIRAAMLAHPRAAPLIAGRPAIGPNGIRGMEILLGIFVRGGFGRDTLGAVYRVYIDYTMSVTARACLVQESQRTPDSKAPYPVAALIDAHLSPEAFPHLRTFGEDLFSGSWGEVFEFGLDRLLTALASACDVPTLR